MAVEKGAGSESPYLDLRDLDAFILDMDGVVTNTARAHAIAWKHTFDEYLRERSQRHGEAFVPFDDSSDYLRYVDGKPRCDGVSSFLSSRHISLPYGGPDDDPGRETICGIGNRKNQHFVQYIRDHGAEPYASTIEFIRWMRSNGARIALISASRNAKLVLERSGLSGLFDVVVDGVEADKLGLNGKPAPDIFLEATRRLGVGPERSAVIEDSLAGVEAGRVGGFNTVIGVDRGGQGDELRRRGADIAVGDLSELRIVGDERGQRMQLPSALENAGEIFKRLLEGMSAIFLDYDGTLTPIVNEPSQAVLSERMREILRELSKNCTLSIISGRGLEDIRGMVGIDGLVYVGSHGFEGVGPDGPLPGQELGEPFLPSLDRAEGELHSALQGIEGAWVERKRFGVTVHFRNVDRENVPRVEALFNGVARRYSDLKMTGGKEILELRPNVDWGKGKVVLALLDRFHVSGPRVIPLYIGDDETDEDAFRALADKGVTILVSNRARRTAAHYVLRDVSEVATFLEELVGHFEKDIANGIWVLRYDGYDPEKEKLRESLFAVGNGYFASRGAAPESTAGVYHYPGSYLAGLYNCLESSVDGRRIVNESIVNVPNWLCTSLRVDDGDWFNIDAVEIHDFLQELDMRRGILSRTVTFTGDREQRTRLEQRRFVSMRSPHLVGLETTITPENWSGNLHILSALDGWVDNTLVSRYQQLNNHHLDRIRTGVSGKEIIWIQAETNQSHIRIAEAARTRVFKGSELMDAKRNLREGLGHIGQDIEVPVEEGTPVRIEKICSIYSSKDRAISESLVGALREVDRAEDFGQLCDEHMSAWDDLWRRCQIEVETDHTWTAQILNLHLFHLLQTVSTHSIDLDVGVPPRGLHGEAYRGLIMWDEIFIFPFLNLRVPDITRSLLLYRYRRLPEARWAARRAGYEGAMYPWQSGSDGREEAQRLHLNPISGEWIPDRSELERHIGLAVAYNIWNYYQVSGDLDFMSFYGAEMLIEIARFWASKVQYNDALGRYEIRGVMGPDEFHEGYHGSKEFGINNNAYTNVMAAWMFCRTLDTLQLLPLAHRRDIWKDLSLSERELTRWDEISRKMYVPFHGDGIISQFDGFDDLEELDWERYRKKYGNVSRLDRILKAEGDSPDRYKVSKQADVLMLFYLFSSDELEGLFYRLGYRLEPDTMQKTIDYYMERTSNGSTLSLVVHAWVLSRINREMSWNLFREALKSDVSDIQGGTTHEGIHLGAMACTVDIVQRCYPGLETRGDVLWFDPKLPTELTRLRFDIEYRHHRIDVEIDRDRLRLFSQPQDIEPIKVGYRDSVQTIAPGEAIEFDLGPQ